MHEVARRADDGGAFGGRVVVEHGAPGAGMAGRGAEVDECLASALGVPRRDGIGPELQLERGRHAVVREELVIDGILTV